MREMDKTAHLAWCALIALLTARNDGLVISESQENIFIMRWFSKAKRQRRFPKDYATDIDWILNQGRVHGVRARLRHKLDYLWRSCSGNFKEQSDLFRLTYAMELIMQYDWIYHLIDDKHWDGRNKIRLNPKVNAICLLKSALDIGFGPDGSQIHPLPVRIAGRVDSLDTLLNTCDWGILEQENEFKLIVSKE
jgi:hypothetical protein